MNNTKILMIVDDDPDDRFFFRLGVKDIDPLWECIEADNGLDALEKLRKTDLLPDFIFLDVNMYLMDGKACLVELKKDMRLKKIPVIMYSTSDFKKDVDRTIELGACFYLRKTSDISKLGEEINKAIAHCLEGVKAE